MDWQMKRADCRALLLEGVMASELTISNHKVDSRTGVHNNITCHTAAAVHMSFTLFVHEFKWCLTWIKEIGISYRNALSFSQRLFLIHSCARW